MGMTYIPLSTLNLPSDDEGLMTPKYIRKVKWIVNLFSCDSSKIYLTSTFTKK